jgi:hypothetical protein
MARPITIDVNIYDVTLTVSGDYEPGEDPIMYDSNMEGYPGSSPEFDLESVELEGVQIIDLLSDDVIELIKEQVIEKQEN